MCTSITSHHEHRPCIRCILETLWAFCKKSTCMFEGLFFVVSEKKIPSTVLKCHMMLKIGPSSGKKSLAPPSYWPEKLIHFPTPLHHRKGLLNRKYFILRISHTHVKNCCCCCCCCFCFLLYFFFWGGGVRDGRAGGCQNWAHNSLFLSLIVYIVNG